MIERVAVGAGLELKAHPHMLRDACGYALANKGTTPGRFRDGGASLYYVDGGLYGPGAEPVQGFLAGVSDIGRMSGLRHSLRIVECGTE